MQDEDGQYLSLPHDIAMACERYWRQVFEEKPCDLQVLHGWAREDLQPLPDFDWAVTFDDVSMAIALAEDSAPGPDGIPYSAYKHVSFAADIVYRALESIAHSPTSPAPADFNFAIMVLLGKKSSGVAPGGVGSFYKPGDTRPLSIVNTDNRIMASAVRFRLEPTLERWTFLSSVVSLKVEA